MLLNYIFKVDFQYFLLACAYMVQEIYPDTIFQTYILPMLLHAFPNTWCLVLLFGKENYNGN